MLSYIHDFYNKKIYSNHRSFWDTNTMKQPLGRRSFELDLVLDWLPGVVLRTSTLTSMYIMANLADFMPPQANETEN